MSSTILFVAFNQDGGCLIRGTTSGFEIFRTGSDTKEEKDEAVFRRDFGKGIQRVEMLYYSNILALVGGGKDPWFPESRVILWNEAEGKRIKSLDFRDRVCNVKLRRDRLVV